MNTDHRKTGIITFNVEYKEQSFDESLERHTKSALMRSMGEHLIQLHSDGRAYVVRYEWQTIEKDNSLFFELSCVCLLLSPLQAEVGEYVSMGNVETIVQNATMYMHLGNDMLFERDIEMNMMWRRIEKTPESISYYQGLLDHNSQLEVPNRIILTLINPISSKASDQSLIEDDIPAGQIITGSIEEDTNKFNSEDLNIISHLLNENDKERSK